MPYEKLRQSILSIAALFFLFFLFNLEVVKSYYRINDNSLLAVCICACLALLCAFLLIAFYHERVIDFIIPFFFII